MDEEVIPDIMSDSTPIPPADVPLEGLGPVATPASATDMLIIVTFFAGLLAPVTILLLFFSTPELRRRPVFFLNVLAITATFVFSGLMIYSLVGSEMTISIISH